MDPEAYAKHNKPESGAQPGIYKHANSQEELHAASFPAADAFVRQGWVYDRPLPKASDQRNVARSEPAPSIDEVKKLRAQLKTEKAARAAAEAEAEQAKADAEKAKTEAANKEEETK